MHQIILYGQIFTNSLIVLLVYYQLSMTTALELHNEGSFHGWNNKTKRTPGAVVQEIRLEHQTL